MSNSHTIFAEQNLLSAMLCHQGDVIALAESKLDSNAFADALNGRLFAAMVRLRTDGTTIDAGTITASLPDSDMSEVATVLTSLYQAKRPVSGVEDYCRIITEAARRREAAATVNRLYATIIKPDTEEDSHALIGNALEELAAVNGLYGGQELGTSSASEIVDRLFSQIEENATSGQKIGISTGFTVVDDYYTMLPGGLITIAARSSMGKSALMLRMAISIAFSGKRVIYFCTEMSETETMLRAIGMLARVSTRRLFAGQLSKEEWEKAQDAANALRSASLHFNDRPDASPAFIRSETKRLRDAIGPVDACFVDYLNRLTPDRSSRQSDRHIEVGMMAQSLKNFAREMKIPVVTAAQINRDNEKAQDKRPVLSSISECDKIAHESDDVLMIYRAEYYKNQDSASVDHTKQEIAEIIIEKQRNGPRGVVVKLGFIPAYSRFQNPEGDFSDWGGAE